MRMRGGQGPTTVAMPGGRVLRFGPLCLVALAPAVCALPSAAGTRDHLKRPPGWFASEEGARITSNILSWQSEAGSWPKNMDPAAKPYTGKDRAKDIRGTFDNGATTDELRFLARAFAATRGAPLRAAVERGVDHILKAQYPAGGWPQFFPPGTQYHRHITFNDGAMVRVMEFVREVSADPSFEFLDPARRKACGDAFSRGVACILRCQVVQDGEPTAWCAQHDEVTLEPRTGRSYELPSLSGSESVGIVRLLMSLDRPSPEVVRAVDGAVAWFRRAQLKGIRVDTVGGDRVVVQDPAAPPLWARFYELGTGRPLFVDRDGVPKYALADIGSERRNGYAWLGNWPAALLEREHPEWKARLSRAAR